MSEFEQVTIHFANGNRAVATVYEDDLEDEFDRVTQLNLRRADEPIESIDEYVESALTEPPRPRWTWIGDVYVFTQAVSGIEIGRDTTGAN